MTTTNRQRVAEYRARMAQQGYRQVTVYVHQDDVERLKRYVERVRKERENAKKQEQ